MVKKILVFKLQSNHFDNLEIKDEGINYEKWIPKLTGIIPPNTSLKYLPIAVTKYLPFVQTIELSAYLVRQKGEVVSSLVCVPALKRWSFMRPNDLQIKNVFTSEKYRGMGYASKLISFALRHEEKESRDFWYMTNDSNLPSQKLCTKLGFKFIGKYCIDRKLYFFGTGKIITE